MKISLKSISGGEILAYAAKIVVSLFVVFFLGIQSINFFQFTFPADQQIYAILGFGLTGGGLIAYILILKYGAKSRLDKVISVLMLGICGIGELATAGFGMQVEVFIKEGRSLTNSDLNVMIWMVRSLCLVHGLALIAMTVGEEIIEAFGNDQNQTIETKTIHENPSFSLEVKNKKDMDFQG